MQTIFGGRSGGASSALSSGTPALSTAFASAPEPGGDQVAQLGARRDPERPQQLALDQHRDAGAAGNARGTELHRTAPRAITGSSASTTPPRAA